MNKGYALASNGKITNGVKFSSLYSYSGLGRKPAKSVEAGDIVALAGVPNIKIGDTITDIENPDPLPGITVEEPTVSMVFYVNSGPFSGREGKFPDIPEYSGAPGKGNTI